jgi:hypothetical protein
VEAESDVPDQGDLSARLTDSEGLGLFADDVGIGSVGGGSAVGKPCAGDEAERKICCFR